ncbi:MAG: Hsp70 family protein, partial [Brachymonas sp.]
IDVKPSYGLSDDEIARMLQDSFGTAQEDMAARALAEARLEADRMVLATRSALNADGDLLTDADRAKVESLVSAALAAKSLEDAVQVEAATKALAEGTEAFAAERMNAGIRRALAGKTVDQV